MNIELIQPRDNHPSVYKEMVDRRGYGFHHVGIAVTDVTCVRADYEARGFRTAFEAPVPSGGSVYYLENGSLDPAFIETDSRHAWHGRNVHARLARADRLGRTGSNQTVRVVGGAGSWISALTVATPRIIRNSDAVRIARAPARLTATDSAITPAISISSMTTPMRPQCKRAASLSRSHRSVSLHRVCRSSMTFVTPSVSRASAIARSRSALDSTVPLSVTVVP